MLSVFFFAEARKGNGDYAHWGSKARGLVLL